MSQMPVETFTYTTRTYGQPPTQPAPRATWKSWTAGCAILLLITAIISYGAGAQTKPPRIVRTVVVATLTPPSSQGAAK
jgi:hypothetical protein